MELETNCLNMQCHPILIYTESFISLAHREVYSKSIAKFVPDKKESL